jgi:hypothetical protein
MTSRTSRLRSVPVITFLLGGFAALAANEPPKAKDDEAARERLAFVKSKADGFVIATEKEPDKPLVREKEPVLRFTNPARGTNTEGTIFLWLSGDRPAAIAALRINPENGTVWREFSSLSDQSLVCKRDGKTIWAPATGALVKKPLPEAPEPAATPALRLVQMRRQAERFKAEFDHLSAGRWETLRLLPQPIYRYTAEKGTVEGAIFALVQANDPEALLILELTRPAGDAKPTWTYALARASSQPMRARLDDKEIWTVKAYWSNPRAKEDPYQETADGKFPAATPPDPPKKM